jgi:MFS family permease
MNRRNIAILSLSQAVSGMGITMVLLLGGLVGADLAPSPAWATLPVALTVVGTALFAVPAALLMRRIGRRLGFAMAAAVAGLGALLAAYAITQGSFALFSAAALFLGANLAFVQQYRFAAVESAEPHFAGRAVSFVLMGGIAAGILGPELANVSKDWLSAAQYSGSFLTLALLQAAVALALLFYRNVTPQQAGVPEPERPLREIVTQPLYLTAVLAGAVAYGMMTFIMTATPIHLHNAHGYTLAQTSLVIQSHVVAMFLPSLFTGFLLERLGVTRVMLSGVAGLVLASILGVLGHDLPIFWGAMVLLGLGWNLLFTGSTVLLTRSYRPAERFKAQAANDLPVFGVQAIASLLAGMVLFYGNWDVLNLIGLTPLVLILALILVRRRMATLPSVA